MTIFSGNPESGDRKYFYTGNLEKILREWSSDSGFILIKFAKSSDGHDSRITGSRLLKNLNKKSAIMVTAGVILYRNGKCSCNTIQK
jgi:hypothetical protein